jgi:hypothetical protein
MSQSTRERLADMWSALAGRPAEDRYTSISAQPDLDDGGYLVEPEGPEEPVAPLIHPQELLTFGLTVAFTLASGWLSAVTFAHSDEVYVRHDVDPILYAASGFAYGYLVDRLARRRAVNGRAVLLGFACAGAAAAAAIAFDWSREQSAAAAWAGLLGGACLILAPRIAAICLGLMMVGLLGFELLNVLHLYHHRITTGHIVQVAAVVVLTTLLLLVHFVTYEYRSGKPRPYRLR